MRALLLLLVMVTPALADPCKAPLPKSGETFSGLVTYVGDGDSLCVGHDRGGIEVRIEGYRARELHEPGGLEAKRLLETLVMGKQVTCVSANKSYDRIVATCTLDGRPLRDLLRQSNAPEGGR